MDNKNQNDNNQLQPDYDFILNQPGSSPPPTTKSSKKVIIIFSVSLVVLTILAAAVSILATSKNVRQPTSQEKATAVAVDYFTSIGNQDYAKAFAYFETTNPPQDQAQFAKTTGPLVNGLFKASQCKAKTANPQKDNPEVIVVEVGCISTVSGIEEVLEVQVVTLDSGTHIRKITNQREVEAR